MPNGTVFSSFEGLALSLANSLPGTRQPVRPFLNFRALTSLDWHILGRSDADFHAPKLWKGLSGIDSHKINRSIPIDFFQISEPQNQQRTYTK